MGKATARYRSYGRQMALALNRGQHLHFEQQVRWYKSDLRKENEKGKIRAEHAKEAAFWEFRNDTVYPCSKGITEFIADNGAQPEAEIRKHCARRCSDYSVKNVTTTLLAFVKQGILEKNGEEYGYA